MRSFWIIFFSIFIGYNQAQTTENKEALHKTSKDSIPTKSIENIVADIESANTYIPKKNITPFKTGLHSAIVPGLGQYYNKKYWKIPIVWGLIGTSIGITMYQNKQYKRYKTAFDLEVNGQENEFSSLGITNLKEALGRQQDNMKRYRDYWIAITGIIYLLNIIDAVVDAHLYQGRKDPDLAITPTMIYQPENSKIASGIELKFRF